MLQHIQNFLGKLVIITIVVLLIAAFSKMMPNRPLTDDELQSLTGLEMIIGSE
jgi:hypothetical protein